MNTLRLLAEAKGWEYDNNFLYLKKGHYHFTVKRFVDHLRAEGNGWILVYLPTHNFTADDKHLISHFIKDHKNDLKIASHQFSENVLIMRLFIPYMRIKGDQLEYLCDQIANFLSEQGIGLTETCVYCGKEKVDTVTRIHRIAYPAHRHCIDDASSGESGES